jgi:hypothetical protein
MCANGYSWASVSSPALSLTAPRTDRSRFDTIKVRLQTTEKSHFKGPVDCLLQTLRNEGFKGLYKGATPPLVGWMFMDSMWAFSALSCPQLVLMAS